MSGIYEEDVLARLYRFASDNGDGSIASAITMGRRNADRLPEILEKIIYIVAKDKYAIREKYGELINYHQNRMLEKEKI